MGKITPIVEALVAAGATSEMILAAVRAAEAEQVNALEQRRRNDADRQARKRDREKSRDVTVRHSDRFLTGAGDARVDDKTSTSEIEPQVKKEGDALTREALEAYSAMADRAGLAVPRSITSGRRQRLQAVIREHGLPTFLEAVAKVGASSFCRGGNERGWKADLDFILQAKSFPKILEGHYDDRKPVAREGPQGKPATIHELLRERRQEFADHVDPTPNGPRLIAAR